MRYTEGTEPFHSRLGSAPGGLLCALCDSSVFSVTQILFL